MEKDISKLVSVVMPAYNAELHIQESIQSIIDQTYSNWELIILDDCSTDGTYEIANSFKNPKIRVYRNLVNLGIVASRNLLFTYTRGEFIAVLDADDISLPERLQEQVKLFSLYPDLCFIGTGVEYFGASTELYTKQLGSEELRTELFFYNPVAHSTVMFNRAVLAKQELSYNPYGFLAEDYELMCRVLVNKQAYLTEKVLVRYRVHAAGISRAREKILSGEFFTLITNLQSLGFNLPVASVVLLHRSLFVKDIKATEVIDVLKLLQKIEQKNNELEVYNISMFHSKLVAFSIGLLHSSVLSVTQYSPFLITVFIKARRYTDVSLSKKQLISFYIKCLIGYKAKHLHIKK